MRAVCDGNGTVYVLVKASAESWLVRDPETGEERYLPAADLDPVEGESPLVVAARELPRPTEPPLATVAV